MDELVLWLRVLLSLGAVLAVLWLLQRRLLQKGRLGGAAALPLKVVARQGLGQKSAVVIVETVGRRFLLGVTEQSISVLHSEDVPEEEQAGLDGFARSLEEASLPVSRTVLEGSILSPRTWQQGADALRKGFRN